MDHSINNLGASFLLLVADLGQRMPWLSDVGSEDLENVKEIDLKVFDFLSRVLNNLALKFEFKMDAGKCLFGR